ncbi:hypothetical protein [Mesorhizobium sp. CAU 1741]|uniref:hypothetical protein n=1 Tax=Mesorhizobium sp. CAU 1741 TaxID=3140366 RepID=UPI00325BDDDF
MGASWTTIFEKHIPRPSYDRPVVCDGFPDHCLVVIIGENSSTDLDTDWWSYWDEGHGFDYDRFMGDYHRRKPRLYGTRLRFDAVRKEGYRVIETNVFRDPGPNGSQFQRNNLPLIQAMINNMPGFKGIIAHGTIARRAVQQLRLPKNGRVRSCRHLRIEKIDVVMGLVRSLIVPVRG